MKPQVTQLRCWLALFSLAASLQITLGYYDPAAQRWINRDPIGEHGGANLATFAANNPIDSVDASGRQSMNGRVPIPRVPPPQTLPELIEHVRQQWEELPLASTNVCSATARSTKGGENNTGNNVPIYVPQTQFKECSQDDANVTQTVGSFKTLCPDQRTSVTCLKLETCMLNQFDQVYRWMPSVRCGKCPDGTRPNPQ